MVSRKYLSNAYSIFCNQLAKDEGDIYVWHLWFHNKAENYI